MAEPGVHLQEGVEFEKRLRWADALAVYERLESRGGAGSEWVDLRLRKANALMELGRMDEARRAFDVCIDEAKATGDSALLARALVGAGVYAGNVGDVMRAEPFLLTALALVSRDGGEQDAQTAGWAMLSLGGLYGKTGRLDLAFVTLERARMRLASVGSVVGVAATWETQAQLRRAMGDEDRWREDLAEALLLYRREGLDEKADRLQPLLGRKLV